MSESPKPTPTPDQLEALLEAESYHEAAQRDAEYAAKRQARYDTVSWRIFVMLHEFTDPEAEAVLELVKVRLSLGIQVQLREKNRPKDAR
jgi:hypothetical protein